MFSSGFVYFQVTRGKATATAPASGAQATEFSKGLDHPRTLMGDYPAVQAVFTSLLVKLGLRRWYRRKPYALVHLPEAVDGGYTPVELRAFREAAEAAGCRPVYLLDAREPPLSPEKIEEVRHTLGSWWFRWTLPRPPTTPLTR